MGIGAAKNNFMIDGTDNNDQSVTLPAMFIPPEAIQEVDVQAATFSGEYGRNIGGQINVITKSGTNRFRGQLWEFYRGNALEPLSIADRRAGLTRTPRLVDHQFGGAFGGPIIRDKTFFVEMLQGNLLRTGPRATSLVTIPTPAGYATRQSGDELSEKRSTDTDRSDGTCTGSIPGIAAVGHHTNADRNNRVCEPADRLAESDVSLLDAIDTAAGSQQLRSGAWL